MPDNSKWINESRRKLLKSTGVAITGGALAGCLGNGNGNGGQASNGSDDNDSTSESGSFNAVIPEYEIESTVIPHIAAIQEVLPENTDGRYTAETDRFNENSTAYKAALTGAVDIFKGAPVMPFQGMKSGSNPRVIGTNVGGSDYVMVVHEEVDGFEDFRNSDRQFGISGKGAISHTQPVGVFVKEGIPEDEVNWVNIGGSSARAQAVAAGNIDGTSLHLEQLQRLKSEDAPVEELAMIKDYYPNFIVNCIAVLPDMLEQREEFVQEYMNAVVQASELAFNDFDWFKQRMQRYFAEPMSDEDAREVWELLTEVVEAWPHDKDSFGKEPYREQMELYQAAGLLEGDVDLDKFIVREYWDNAVDNL